jgi:hypothetical protein
MACEYYTKHISVTDKKNMQSITILYCYVTSVLCFEGLVGYRPSIFRSGSSDHTSHEVTSVAPSLHLGQQLSQQGISMQHTNYPRVCTCTLLSFLFVVNALKIIYQVMGVFYSVYATLVNFTAYAATCFGRTAIFRKKYS